MAKEKDSRIGSLIKENEKLMNESFALKAEIASKTEKLFKAKRFKKDDSLFGAD